MGWLDFFFFFLACLWMDLSSFLSICRKSEPHQAPFDPLKTSFLCEASFLPFCYFSIRATPSGTGVVGWGFGAPLGQDWLSACLTSSVLRKALVVTYGCPGEQTWGLMHSIIFWDLWQIAKRYQREAGRQLQEKREHMPRRLETLSSISAPQAPGVLSQ